jgi:MFS family permease
MKAELTLDPARSALASRLPFYYGWVQVVMAALAMLGTLPGRTQGLGLITEPLLRDLAIDRNDYAHLNLWATLIGSLFCLPAGRLIDRFGTRTVLAALALCLGLTVWTMSAVVGFYGLFALVLLTRGFGQSALSVASIAIVGKWFRRRVGLAMGVYSFLVGLSFIAGFKLLTAAVKTQGWRLAWWEISLTLLAGLLPLTLLLVRSTPESCGIESDEMQLDDRHATTGFRLEQALRTPAFWIFALGASLYGLAVSGIGLFNEAILRERGFDRDIFYSTYMFSIPAGLIGQLASGVIAWRWSLRRLMVVAMLLYGGALAWLPSVSSLPSLYSCVVLMGLAGGMITVTFFAVWPAVFGRAQLGRIQGAAQMLTVLASAVGPMLFSRCLDQTDSYMPAFYVLSAVVLALAIGTLVVRMPDQSDNDSTREPAAAAP